jgi:hypothetical protein
VEGSQERGRFFEKKLCKKLLLISDMGREADTALGGKSIKFFCFFLFTKRSSSNPIGMFSASLSLIRVAEEDSRFRGDDQV